MFYLRELFYLHDNTKYYIFAVNVSLWSLFFGKLCKNKGNSYSSLHLYTK